MQLKLFVLSASALTLWLVPLIGLNKQVSWHKAIQGISLCSAIACAVSAGNIAKHQADEDEIETIKARAIKADIVDEISTSAYVSQQSRQQEAEALLAAPAEDMEGVRERLEALYKPESEEEAEVALTAVSDTSLELARKSYAEIKEAMEAGKANTWIIENILKMKGRKFAEGKIKLHSLLSQFEDE